VLIAVYPIGLIRLWLQRWDRQTKIIHTVFWAVYFYFVMMPSEVNYIKLYLPHPPAAPIHIREEALYKEFSSDAAAANKKYDGQNIILTGAVDGYDVSTPSMREAWVSLHVGDKDKFVACYFTPNELKEIKDLKMDEEVTVDGRGVEIDDNPNVYFALYHSKLTPK